MEMCMYKFVAILMFISLTAFAGKPSWKTFAFHIDGVKTQEDADAIQKVILETDPKMIKKAEGLTPESGCVFIYHDHHNTTFQKIGLAILAAKDVKVYTKLQIPDYQKVQGTIIGDKLNKVLNTPGRGFKIDTIDSQKGLFEVVIQKGEYEGKGFNFGGLAHAISDPIVYGGLGLNLRYIGGGEGGTKGQMIKDVNEKEVRFRKTGKKLKEFSPEVMKVYKKLFNFPPEKLKKYYQ